MSPRLAFAIESARAAGRLTLAYFQNNTLTEIKDDGTPVTAADREAEALIRRSIASSYPGESILGEEEGGDPDTADRWVVDPIDGTKSFICGVPLFATLVSYEQDGIPVVGACYFPALDEMVYAERGFGAYWNGRQIQVSKNQVLKDSVISVGSHNGLRVAGLDRTFTKLAKDVRATRTWCDAYGHALVARGSVEAMLDPFVSRWDISSLQVIIEEAGGTMTDLAGKSNPSNQALSTNALLHEQLLGRFAE